jgi:hypothetical protein
VFDAPSDLTRLSTFTVPTSIINALEDGTSTIAWTESKPKNPEGRPEYALLEMPQCLKEALSPNLLLSDVRKSLLLPHQS